MEEDFKIQEFKSWDDNHENVFVSQDVRNILSSAIPPNKKIRLYRYNQFHYLYIDIEKQQIVFISPKKWDDPFENKSLLSDDIFCVCTKYVSNINEEASWTQYSKNAKSPLLRLSLKFEELIKLLNDLGLKYKINFYFGMVDYSFDRKTISKFIANCKRNISNLRLEEKLSLMCLKRKAFNYEKEIRIFAVPQSQSDNKFIEKCVSDQKMILSFKNINTNWKSIIGSITLPPLSPISSISDTEFYELQKIINGGIEDYLRDYFSIPRRVSFKKSALNKKTSVIVNSALYRE